MNVELLKKLAIYLNNLPADYGHFDMRRFYSNADAYQNDTARTAKPPSECGAVACAIGHLPFVQGAPEPEWLESWRDYAMRSLLENERNRTILYNYMFSGYWSDIDNTAHGAAKRIWSVATGKVDILDMLVCYTSMPYYENIEVGRE